MSFWNKILWSDETKVHLFGADGAGVGSVMVWGSMAGKGVGNLTFIDTKMNAEVYVNILEQTLKASAQKLGLPKSLIFMQDNDPKHTSAKVMTFFKQKKVNVLDWPAQSADVNPIEYLWDALKRNFTKPPVPTSETYGKGSWNTGMVSTQLSPQIWSFP